MEVYLHPLRKPPKAEGDISRVLLILPLLCLMFISHFMFIKHKDLWSSPPSLLLGEGKGSWQRQAAGDGDATCCRARDIPASPHGDPRPSLWTHPALKTLRGQAMSLLGWVQTQGVLTGGVGQVGVGDAGRQGKLYQGHPRNTPKGGIRCWETCRCPRAMGQCSPGPRLRYCCWDIPGEGASGVSTLGPDAEDGGSLTQLFARDFQPQLAKTS